MFLFAVVTVSHALEALSLLGEKRAGEKPYDVILADVHMPVMDGFELLRHVNNNFDIPVVRKFLYTHNQLLTYISLGFIDTYTYMCVYIYRPAR